VLALQAGREVLVHNRCCVKRGWKIPMLLDKKLGAENTPQIVLEDPIVARILADVRSVKKQIRWFDVKWLGYRRSGRSIPLPGTSYELLELRREGTQQIAPFCFLVSKKTFYGLLLMRKFDEYLGLWQDTLAALSKLLDKLTQMVKEDRDKKQIIAAILEWRRITVALTRAEPSRKEAA